MTYTVLARKYRPQRFEDLVGQEPISRTLQNAITKNRVAHSFLFTGARGVGKTTSARILAKALNCETGPTPTPCNACDSCRDITHGSDIDVLEMDGASHNSVDDVRRLQETVPFRPTRSRYRIIIIDEVHMLSTGAFNALLKTLEEPPPHIKFIFATTEAHKVPVTIRSRCQRYDFRLVPRATLAEYIRKILEAESINADDAAIDIISREAAGSVRDALTLLDQLAAGGHETLLGAEVAHTLGLTDRAVVADTLFAVLLGDPRAVLQHVRRVAEHGGDSVHFAKQLLELSRELTVMKIDSAASSYVDLPQDERNAIGERLAPIDALEPERAFVGLSVLINDIARSVMPHLTLEMGLLRLATRPRLVSIEALLGQLQSGEKGPSSQPSQRPVQGQPQNPAFAHRAVPLTPAPQQNGSPRVAEEPVGEIPSSANATLSASSLGNSQPAPLNKDLSWEDFVVALRDRRPALGAVLEHGVLMQKTAELWTVGFAEGSFFGRQADQPEAREAMRALLEDRLGQAPKIEIRVYRDQEKPGETLVQKHIKEREDARESLKREALTHPIVKETMEIFASANEPPEIRLYEDEDALRTP